MLGKTNAQLRWNFLAIIWKCISSCWLWVWGLQLTVTIKLTYFCRNDLSLFAEWGWFGLGCRQLHEYGYNSLIIKPNEKTFSQTYITKTRQSEAKSMPGEQTRGLLTCKWDSKPNYTTCQGISHTPIEDITPDKQNITCIKTRDFRLKVQLLICCKF